MMLLRLSLRNVRRNIRRTLLTAATIVIATGLMTVALAWLQGIIQGVTEDFAAVAGHMRIADTDYLEREVLAPMYENIPDADPVLDQVRTVPGVVDVEPLIQTGAVFTVGEEIGEDFGLVYGARESWYQRWLKGPQNVVDGTWLTGDKDEVVLGVKLAERIEASVGDEVLLLGQTQYGSMSPISADVVGILAKDGTTDSAAFIRYEDAQWFLDLPDGAMQILVYTDDHEVASVAPVARSVAALELEGLSVQTWYGKEPFASMLGMLDGIQVFLAGVIVFITSLAIFNTMTMSVLERTDEVGLMRAMGMTGAGAVWMFVVEALVIGVLGGLGGVAIGSLGAYYLEVVGITLGQELADKVGESLPFKATFYADLNAEVVITAFVLGLVIAAVGAFLPSLRAASIEPVTAMRSGR